MAVDQSGNKALEISGCTEKSLTEAVCVCGGIMFSREGIYKHGWPHGPDGGEKGQRNGEKADSKGERPTAGHQALGGLSQSHSY